MAQPSGAAARHKPGGGDEPATSRPVVRTDGFGPGPGPGPASGSSSGSSHCTSDCVSAKDRLSPQPPSSPALLGPAEKWAVMAFEPDPGGGGGGPPSDRPVSPTQMTVRERQLVIQNQLLKSTLIRALEKLQLHMEDSSWTRQLLSRLQKLRSSSSAQQAQQAADPAGTTSSAQAPADLYARYEALVKHNYRLEEALRHSSSGGGQMAATGHRQLDEYKAVANLQMTTMQQDWRDEREEKERALALNAELHQQVEQLQHQLEQLQQQQQQRQPLSEPFETLEPSGFTGSSSWGPQPRRMIPQPGHTQPLRRGIWPTHWAEREVRTRGLGPARSVDQVLSAPYEAIRAEPPPMPGRRPPVESDLRRPLPPPGRQPAPQADLYRPAPPVLRDSGYSDLLGAGADDGDALPLLSRASVDTGTEDEWTTLQQPADLAGVESKGAAPPDSAGTHWAAPAPAPASDEYAATNTTHQVTCPHCGAVFAVNEHLVYLNHVEECPSRRRRRGARPCPN